MSVGYGFFGGADDESKRTIPLQRGPRADVVLTHELTRIDALATTVSASRTQGYNPQCPIQPNTGPIDPTAPPAAAVDCSPTNDLIVGVESWRHAFSSRADGSIGVGLSAVHIKLETNNAVDPKESTHVYPAASATYGYKFGFEGVKTTFHLDASLAPVVDFRTGVADNRAQAAAILAFTSGHFGVSQTGGVARAFGTSIAPGASFILSTTEAHYEPSPHIAFNAGVNYVWQRQDDRTFSSAIGFVGVTLRASALRF
jgi:hypothetical protein